MMKEEATRRSTTPSSAGIRSGREQPEQSSAQHLVAHYWTRDREERARRCLGCNQNCWGHLASECWTKRL